MDSTTQLITDDYAIYNNDCLNILPELPADSVDFSVYSPPFASLYNYSSSDRDMSNCRTYGEFLEHYRFLVTEIARVTKPGRLTAVHCFAVPRAGYRLRDFPGDIIRLHESLGFYYADEHIIWKEPLHVAIKTRSRGLMHKTIVQDSSFCRAAIPDKILVFRRAGTNAVPIAHPAGLSRYAGEHPVPQELLQKYKYWADPRTNKLSHWIWQQYASPVWMDIRLNRVLEYRKARDAEDERHVCPLMLDIIERCLTLWSNPGDTVLTPFMGVGSEVYCSVRNGRRAIGVELKPSYYRQAVRNVARAIDDLRNDEDPSLFDVHPDAAIGNNEDEYEGDGESADVVENVTGEDFEIVHADAAEFSGAEEE